ncbi:MAG: hypothetical protein KBA28_08360 [Syntrophaceae bacterium]|jgi:hypothetical protein|nr:hypothetical protein [Syntrophaceae bacterium]HOC59165.1 hypothetical protein [Smithellaceae bacterium]
MSNLVRKVNAGEKVLKRLYLFVFLWFTGRAVQAAAKVDDQVKKEFDAIPNGFTFALGVMPKGPWMVIGKVNGKIKYLGWSIEGIRLNLRLAINNIEAAMLIFTFQEGTALATARNRIIVDGEVPYAMSVIRVLDIVEVYLLVKIIAKLAVKRYPVWWPRGRKYVGRILIYTRTLLGF